jgi:hypothetical protein
LIAGLSQPEEMGLSLPPSCPGAITIMSHCRCGSVVTAYLIVLFAAIRQHGAREALVSDSGGIFLAKEAQRIYRALDIRKCYIYTKIKQIFKRNDIELGSERIVLVKININRQGLHQGIDKGSYIGIGLVLDDSALPLL